MTITNHIRVIESLAGSVLILVDSKEYGKAHIVLDDIEKKVRLARHHIEHLQLNADVSSTPAGGF